jgi:hypothetical protein
VLINNQPFQAATQPLAGSGAGAVLCAGALAGDVVLIAYPRLRPTVEGGAFGARVVGGHLQSSSRQYQLMTLIDPVAKGGVGPHPAREPEPV